MANRSHCRQPGNDTVGRVDLLVIGCAELVMRRVEGLISARVGEPVNLWDGPDGVGGLVSDFCDSTGLTGFKLTPRDVVARAVGGSAGARRFARKKAVR